jgi:hypothetical protein
MVLGLAGSQVEGVIMKTFAYFSAGGVLEAIVAVDAPDHVRAGLQLEPNQMTAEVQSAELAGGGADVEKIREILKHHRIAQPSSQPCKLVRA